MKNIFGESKIEARNELRNTQNPTKKVKLEDLFESQVVEKKKGKKNEPQLGEDQTETVDRMEELQKRKDREGGAHLDMMIKQTERGAKKAKNLQLNKVFVEDKLDIVKEIDPPLKEKFEFEDEKKNGSVPKEEEKKVEKVSLIDIKMDQFEEPEKKETKKEKSEGDLNKRNNKEFENQNYANMFDSDKEEESRRSERSEKGFLEEQNEKKERERRLKEEEADKTMKKKVENYLMQEKKREEPEEDLDEKEEEPLNSQDDISGKSG